MRLRVPFLALVAVPLTAAASTLVPHTLAQRAAEADRVVLAQVVDQRVERGGPGEFALKTLTRVVVGESVKGSGPAELTVVQLGGRLGLETMTVPGDARLVPGETAVLFLRCRRAVDRCHLVALGAGKLDVVGGEALVKDLFTGGWARRELRALLDELRSPAVGAPTVAPRGAVTR